MIQKSIKTDDIIVIFKRIISTAGKTTLAKHFFPDRSYVSLEDPEILEFALTDLRGFL